MNDLVNKLNAMVVDDDEMTQQLMAALLEKAGVDVTLVDSGSGAIKTLRETKPDIIFLDVLMPGLDGYETCKLLKANPSTKDIPVIMLTSNDGFFDKMKGRRVGADVYLTKPVKYDEILGALKKYFPSVA